MYRMQYHFETPTDEFHQSMLASSKKAALIAEEKGIRPGSIWISHDERPRRIVIEFTGADQWDCDRQQREGAQDPDLGPLLAEVFKGHLTSVEVYESVRSH